MYREETRIVSESRRIEISGLYLSAVKLLSLRSPASSGRIIPFPVDNRNEWNQQFMLVHKWILFSILFPVQFCDGRQRRYLHGTNNHAGQRLGTGLPEVFSVEGSDPAILGSVPGSHQVAIISEGRAKEGMTVHVIRACLQAKPAFEAFGGGVLMRVVPVFRRLIFPDIHIPYFVSIYLAVISIWLVPKSFS